MFELGNRAHKAHARSNPEPAKPLENVSSFRARKNGASVLLLSVVVVWLAGSGTGRTVSIDPSNRYYRDGSGRPVFFIGYYGWAAVPDGYFIDHPSRYATMIQRGAPYKINYIRISLCVNRFTSTTT